MNLEVREIDYENQGSYIIGSYIAKVFERAVSFYYNQKLIYSSPRDSTSYDFQLACLGDLMLMANSEDIYLTVITQFGVQKSIKLNREIYDAEFFTSSFVKIHEKLLFLYERGFKLLDQSGKLISERDNLLFSDRIVRTSPSGIIYEDLSTGEIRDIAFDPLP